uniref:Ribosomal protein L4 n=1 Tax=Molossus molossus TaxID=27622 RepID=A0A7J8FSE9_MOLMO|nr:hypothetical protein HJG59_008375 [Molossus molossus]
MRAGKSKRRNHHPVQHRGLCLAHNEENGIKAFRNIPGITLHNVRKLDMLKLVPGGHVGCVCVWTESVFHKLDGLYGTWHKAASLKSNYNLPMHKVLSADPGRFLKSPEIHKSSSNTQGDSSQSPEGEPTEHLRVLKLHPYAKTMSWNTIFPRPRTTYSGG